MHRNAPLTPEGRRRLCELVENGWTVASAAESMRISRQTAHKWWQPDPDSFQFQIQKDNEMLKRQGFDPYSPA